MLPADWRARVALARGGRARRSRPCPPCLFTRKRVADRLRRLSLNGHLWRRASTNGNTRGVANSRGIRTGSWVSGVREILPDQTAQRPGGNGYRLCQEINVAVWSTISPSVVSSQSRKLKVHDLKSIQLFTYFSISNDHSDEVHRA